MKLGGRGGGLHLDLRWGNEQSRMNIQWTYIHTQLRKGNFFITMFFYCSQPLPSSAHVPQSKSSSFYHAQKAHSLLTVFFLFGGPLWGPFVWSPFYVGRGGREMWDNSGQPQWTQTVLASSLLYEEPVPVPVCEKQGLGLTRFWFPFQFYT